MRCVDTLKCNTLNVNIRKILLERKSGRWGGGSRAWIKKILFATCTFALSSFVCVHLYHFMIFEEYYIKDFEKGKIPNFYSSIFEREKKKHVLYNEKNTFMNSYT